MYKFKKSQIALGLAALTIVSTIGIASTTMAAGTVTGTNASPTSIAAHLKFNKNHNKVAPTAAQIAAVTAKKAAVSAAISANDYNAWVTAVGPNAPILKQVTAANFSTYVQAYNLEVQANALEVQARTLMTGIGVKGEGFGMMGGMGGHMNLNLTK
jgi:hypothetical protein